MGIQSQEQVTLLTDYDTDSAYSIAYHTLYANIRFNWDSERVKQQAILLATPAPYAGRAAAAVNVAIAAAQNETPTLVVDADLRAPSLQQRFAIGKSAGLSDLLTAEVVTPQTIAPYLNETFIPHLRVLCAGTSPKQDTGLLLSSRLRELLTAIRQFLAETESKPSLIIFTGPPVLAGVDTSLIATLVEQTFLTIASGRTTRSQAKRAQEQLQRAHAQLAGIIMLDI